MLTIQTGLSRSKREATLINSIKNLSETYIGRIFLLVPEPVSYTHLELVKTYYPDKTTQEQRLIGSATPFIIWTNYDSPSEEDIVVSPSILGAMVAQQAGFDLPALPNLIMYRIYPKISVAHEAGVEMCIRDRI